MYRQQSNNDYSDHQENNGNYLYSSSTAYSDTSGHSVPVTRRGSSASVDTTAASTVLSTPIISDAAYANYPGPLHQYQQQNLQARSRSQTSSSAGGGGGPGSTSMSRQPTTESIPDKSYYRNQQHLHNPGSQMKPGSSAFPSGQGGAVQAPLGVQRGMSGGGQPSASSSMPPTVTNAPSNGFGAGAAGAGTQAASAPQKIILQTTERRGKLLLNDNGFQPARLVYHTTYGGKMNWQLSKTGETTIGRKDDNTVVLSDAKISKYHAVIKKTEQGYVVTDKNSSNGVKVNESLIEKSTPTLLHDGDSLLIGSINLFFYDEVREDTSFRDAAGATSPGSQGASNRPMSYYNEDPLAFTNTNLPTNVTDRPRPVSMAPRRPTSTEEQYLKLVTILPEEKKYEEVVTIREEVDATEQEVDFRKLDEDSTDIVTLKEDYEKLRLAYELSKISIAHDISQLLEKSLQLMFDIMPVDRGVVLLVDQNTGIMGTHYVKLREGKANEGREILLSSTILRKVYYSRKALITSDAYEDPMLGKAASVRYGQIRSVICVPLIGHNKVHGILHLDSRDRINSFSSKDLSLVKTISNQTAMAIENNMLVKEVEAKARITEQLSRFLAPHVVDRMVHQSEIIRKGGQIREGTIIFADIRGFTQLSENSTPSEVVNLLNDYFERLVRIVFKYDGVVDKYIGDALMATFGTLDEETDSEYRSVAAALEMKLAIKDMNIDRQRAGKEPVYVGVGVNTGELLSGFIGSSQRLEYTCIGDTVNTSSRICSMAARNQVLISEMTYEKVKNRVEAVPVGMRQFKGKAKEVMVYEALSLKRVPGN
ncbi:hypothetical protein BJ742DRAFT_840892 [Cladochytrium replicatum]|nr:hypothetical protein BJ742DRAFT_840892 [Cladochytrium replicatum]